VDIIFAPISYILVGLPWGGGNIGYIVIIVLSKLYHPEVIRITYENFLKTG